MRSDFRLTPTQKMDARAALSRLKQAGSDLTLEDCVRMAIGRGGDLEAVAVEDALEEFMESRRKRVRENTLEFYSGHCTAIARAFDGRKVSGISRKEWTQFCGDYEHRRRVVSIFLRWAAQQDPPMAKAQSIPTQAATKRQYSQPQVITPDQAQDIMDGAAEHAAAVALLLFAGIRPGELGGAYGKPWLLWEGISVEERWVRIPGDLAKTGKPRIMEDLPGNLWQWLEVYREDPDRPVAKMLPVQIWRRMRQAVPDYPRNAARHSFASYHLALHGSTEKTAYMLGHEGGLDVLFRHYRGIVTKKESNRYFSVCPKRWDPFSRT